MCWYFGNDEIYDNNLEVMQHIRGVSIIFNYVKYIVKVEYWKPVQSRKSHTNPR